MKTKYHFYADPGHGWLKVTRQELRDLGILNKITPFSYMRGDFVYLEEDCDLSTFMQAKREQGAEITFHQHHAERYSKIRSYADFRA